MALSGLTVTCSYTGTPSYNPSAPPLLSLLVWQETPSTGVVTTNAAPGANAAYGPCVFEVYASADSYVSYGASPASAGTLRVFVPAATVCDFICQPGDKLAWVAA